MSDLGVRLQLLIGANVPAPAPFAVVDALTELTVQNNDRQRDGFQLSFTLGKEPLRDYSLLQLGLLDPPNRVVVLVFINALPQILIDGVITRHEVRPSNQPGQSTLTVTGEDISLRMDLEQKRVTHRNMPDSLIVTRILGAYATYGIVPMVTPTTDVPIEVNRVPSQHGTDLAYIGELARANGFVFYVEPGPLPGSSTAYWGPEDRLGAPQPALTMNMGGATNVDAPISFSLNALGPVDPQINVLETGSRQAIPVPVPRGLMPPLSSRPVAPLRRTLPPGTARLDTARGATRAMAETSESDEAVTGSGEVDAVRYGRALRSRRLVGVRGAGLSYNGLYYVQQVTHRIRRGSYRQSFTLKRDGLGALLPTVIP